jgi:hypothetical protein
MSVGFVKKHLALGASLDAVLQIPPLTLIEDILNQQPPWQDPVTTLWPWSANQVDWISSQPGR